MRKYLISMGKILIVGICSIFLYSQLSHQIRTNSLVCKAFLGKPTTIIDVNPFGLSGLPKDPYRLKYCKVDKETNNFICPVCNFDF